MTRYDDDTVSLALMLLLAASLTTTLAFPLRSVYSDSLTGGVLTQRIGNFDVELKTVPTKPLAGEITKIFLRIGSINGDDVVDTPITLKLLRHGEEILTTNTIIVPYGHYTYSYEFVEPDIYGINIEIQDDTTTEETITQSEVQNLLFIFPISVHSKLIFGLSEFQIALIMGGIIISVPAIIFFSLKRKRNITKTSYQ